MKGFRLEKTVQTTEKNIITVKDIGVGCIVDYQGHST